MCSKTASTECFVALCRAKRRCPILLHQLDCTPARSRFCALTAWYSIEALSSVLQRFFPRPADSTVPRRVTRAASGPGNDGG